MLPFEAFSADLNQPKKTKSVTRPNHTDRLMASSKRYFAALPKLNWFGMDFGKDNWRATD